MIKDTLIKDTLTSIENFIFGEPNNNFKKCRIEAGFTVAEVERISGVTRPTIKKAERGKEGEEVGDAIKRKLFAALNESKIIPKKFTFEDIFPSVQESTNVKNIEVVRNT